MEIDEKELAGLRRKAGKYDKDTALDEAERDRFIKLMDAEQGKDRADAEKWRRLMALFDTSCDKCFLGHVCGTHRKAEAVCEDIKEAMETNDER